MAENKKSFLLYVDQSGIFDKLPDEIAGKLIKLIFSYVKDESPIIDDLLLSIAFEPIKQSLKRDLKSWEIFQAKQSENGKKGGRPTKPTAKIENPNNPSLFLETQKSLSVSVSVSDSVIVNNNLFIEIISYLNQKTGKAFKPNNQKTRSLLSARLKESWTVEQIKLVIDRKVSEWLDDPKMSLYLRPETLFGTKFEGYLNDIIKETAIYIPKPETIDFYEYCQNT